MKIFPVALSLLALRALAAAPVLPVPAVVEPVAALTLQPSLPSDVRIGGWLGARIDANVSHRLLVVDTEPLLAGYRHRPGSHPWIGEHVGKWLHAATLAWAYTGDEALRRKLDGVVADLIATQEPDGYLGTYAPDKRLGMYEGATWDVWSHKYNLIGLLTYYRYTGSAPALAAARRIGDLLIATFPAKRSIIGAGEHMGLAATSVLEPMVALYRATGDARYLEFSRYIIRSYEEPGGPDLIRVLLAPNGRVSRVANGKAYEMLSNLVGVVDLYEVTGDPKLLQAAENAWADITRNRLYLTGASSIRELYSSDHLLPNGEEAHVGETCVTTTWIQLSSRLLGVTGEAKYADEIERALYNHLTAAQNPRGDDWCYYTALEGVKHYDSGITCCHSSGPRALALAPTFAYLRAGDTLVVNTLETSSATFGVGGSRVELRQESGFPYSGHSTLTVSTGAPARFALRIRVPAWAAPLHAGAVTGQAGWLDLPEREWKNGDRVDLSFNLAVRMIPGEYTNQGRAAFAWGPFALALDTAESPGYAAGYDAPQFIRVHGDRLPTLASASGRLVFQGSARGEWDNLEHPVRLVPFADAGSTGGRFAVWLDVP